MIVKQYGSVRLTSLLFSMKLRLVEKVPCATTGIPKQIQSMYFRGEQGVLGFFPCWSEAVVFFKWVYHSRITAAGVYSGHWWPRGRIYGTIAWGLVELLASYLELFGVVFTLPAFPNRIFPAEWRIFTNRCHSASMNVFGTINASSPQSGISSGSGDTPHQFGVPKVRKIRHICWNYTQKTSSKSNHVRAQALMGDCHKLAWPVWAYSASLLILHANNSIGLVWKWWAPSGKQYERWFPAMCPAGVAQGNFQFVFAELRASVY